MCSNNSSFILSLWVRGKFTRRQLSAVSINAAIQFGAYLLTQLQFKAHYYTHLDFREVQMLQRKRHLNGGFTVGLRSFTAVLHFNFTRLKKVPFICSRLPETTLPLSPPRPPKFNLAGVTFHLFLCKIQPTVYKRIANLSVTWNLHHFNSLRWLNRYTSYIK